MEMTLFFYVDLYVVEITILHTGILIFQGQYGPMMAVLQVIIAEKKGL